MTQHRHAVACIILASAFSAALRAQEQPAAQGSTPLQVQIVISRYQGDKKVSSLPYTLSIHENNRKTSLRMSSDIPIVSTMIASPASPKAAPPQSSYQYRSVGTMIDCTANPSPGNQYRLALEIEDSSVYPDDQARTPKGGVPTFRSFKLSNTLLLKDGQSTQLTSASDKVSGEVLKVDVTLTVVK